MERKIAYNNEKSRDNFGEGRGSRKMEKRTFRPLTPEDRPWLERCREIGAHPFTALNPVSLIAWADGFGLTVAGDEDFFVVRSRYDSGYYAPVGNPEKCAAFMAETAEKEDPARFVYVTEPAARELAAKGWNVIFRPDLSEYIVASDRLALAPGTYITQSFRNKCKRFARDYAGYSVAPVTAENLDRLEEISERYRSAQNALPADQPVVETELAHFGALGLRGILLTVPDGREAFIFGYENTPEMFTATMTRHDPTLPQETTTILVHEIAKVLRSRYPLINVEEDMGLDGLRRAKQLLAPVDLMKVYEVRA